MDERELLTNGLCRLIPSVCPQAVDKLLWFSALLLEKNKVMNLTAVTDPTEVATRHFLDCAVLAPRMADGGQVLDVGTGAGFPGIPLAVLCPGTNFTLLDAQRKRIGFLNEVVAALGLTNVTAVHARAEEFAKEHRAKFDTAVSRAVADLRVLAELTLPLVKTGGVFFAMKAADCDGEVEQAENAVRTLGGAPALVQRYTVPVSGVARAIVQITKAGETPAAYPRRFKKIETKPL